VKNLPWDDPNSDPLGDLIEFNRKLEQEYYKSFTVPFIKEQAMANTPKTITVTVVTDAIYVSREEVEAAAKAFFMQTRKVHGYSDSYFSTLAEKEWEELYDGNVHIQQEYQICTLEALKAAKQVCIQQGRFEVNDA